MTGAGGPSDQGADAGLLSHVETAFGGAWPRRIGLAVSGGGDSMALLHLFARVAPGHGARLHAVTVDHRLRPEAADEARFVAETCARLGAAHDTLVWGHDGPIAGNLQDSARRARYGLIADWARGQGVGHVALGHTADDQAETLLMGLARAAGLDGLAGMRRRWCDGGIEWSRPLLGAGRQALRDYLDRQGLAWADDPSNADGAYARIRARRALKCLAPLGITVGGLGRVAANLAAAQGALRSAAAAAAAGMARTSAGEVIIDQAAFCGADAEIRRRILIAALCWLARPAYPPRGPALSRIEAAMIAGRPATLGGCRLTVCGPMLHLSREPRAVADLAAPTTGLWDSRWRITGPHDPGLTVRALGQDGLRDREGWRLSGLTRTALLVSPAIWRGRALVAAPLLDRNAEWQAEIDASLNSFLFSH